MKMWGIAFAFCLVSKVRGFKARVPDMARRTKRVSVPRRRFLTVARLFFGNSGASKSQSSGVDIQGLPLNMESLDSVHASETNSMPGSKRSGLSANGVMALYPPAPCHLGPCTPQTQKTQVKGPPAPGSLTELFDTAPWVPERILEMCPARFTSQRDPSESLNPAL